MYILVGASLKLVVVVVVVIISGPDELSWVASNERASERAGIPFLSTMNMNEKINGFFAEKLSTFVHDSIRLDSNPSMSNPYCYCCHCPKYRPGIGLGFVTRTQTDGGHFELYFIFLSQFRSFSVLSLAWSIYVRPVSMLQKQTKSSLLLRISAFTVL